MKKTIAQFVPIILIFLLLTNSTSLIRFSHTILGKLLAVCFIIFYTTVDKLTGLFVCGLIILFYQTEYVENMLNMGSHEQFTGYAELYDNISISPNTEVQDTFRKQNCDAGVLKYKDLQVNDGEMAEHLFTGIKFNNGSCNPCSKSCSFSVIESKMEAEDKLTPMQSK